MMKFYLSGSIRGGRELEETYKTILNYLHSKGHVVLDEHVASSEVYQIEEQMEESEIFTQDIRWLTESDGVIAEVSVPSLGVGYEIAYALENLKKPVLGVYHISRVPISAMISGNTSPNLLLYSYNGIDELLEHIEQFIQSLNLKETR